MRGGQQQAPAALTAGKGHGTHYTGGWRVPGPVWTGVEYIALTELRTPNHPVRGQLLYPLSFPGSKDEAYMNFSPFNKPCLKAICHMVTSTENMQRVQREDSNADVTATGGQWYTRYHTNKSWGA
jgi:hypothetical protein